MLVLVSWNMLLVKVYVLVTVVTETPKALVQDGHTAIEVAVELAPVRPSATVVLVVTAEVIVPTVVTVTKGGAYQL
mgnify:CR=1 FL=1